MEHLPFQWNTKIIRKSRYSVSRLAGPWCEARLNIGRMVVFWFLVIIFVFSRFVFLSHIKFTIYCFFLQVISYNSWQPLYIWILKRYTLLSILLYVFTRQYDEKPSSFTLIVIVNIWNKNRNYHINIFWKFSPNRLVDANLSWKHWLKSNIVHYV